MAANIRKALDILEKAVGKVDRRYRARIKRAMDELERVYGYVQKEWESQPVKRLVRRPVYNLGLAAFERFGYSPFSSHEASVFMYKYMDKIRRRQRPIIPDNELYGNYWSWYTRLFKSGILEHQRVAASTEGYLYRFKKEGVKLMRKVMRGNSSKA